jgi:nitronate monooxygenase
MPLPKILQNLAIPAIAAPMFTISYPELVIAQCQSGIVGAFPSLNARSTSLLDEWLFQIKEALACNSQIESAKPVGPLAVNQIIHPSNKRLEADVEVCLAHKVPIFITSLHEPIKEVVDTVHAYGGIILHDVTNIRHAHKALEAGVDGLILVSAGAGGHGGTLSPFALIGEIRRFFKGLVVLSGAISNGQAIFAARAAGADLAYLGTRFIATCEANASEAYKNAIVEAQASDILYTPYFTGIHGNYLRSSIVKVGLDPDNLPKDKNSTIRFHSGMAKTWKDIWGAGQGVGLIDDIPNVASLVARLKSEYHRAYTQFFEQNCKLPADVMR